MFNNNTPDNIPNVHNNPHVSHPPIVSNVPHSPVTSNVIHEPRLSQGFTGNNWNPNSGQYIHDTFGPREPQIGNNYNQQNRNSEVPLRSYSPRASGGYGKPTSS